MYARNGFSGIVFLSESKTAVRIWCILHTHLGGIVLGNWYRAPDAGSESIDSLTDELDELKQHGIGFLLCGDMNIHHQRRLHFSNGNTPLGNSMMSLCQQHALKQVVTSPTRGRYLLDLVLSDLAEFEKTTIIPAIADHGIVDVCLKVSVPMGAGHSRLGWNYAKANWNKLENLLGDTDWNSVFTDDVDQSCAAVTKTIIEACSKCIPKRLVSCGQRPHRWVNEECVEAIQHKCNSYGSATFKVAERDCTIVLNKAFNELRCPLRTGFWVPKCATTKNTNNT